MPRVAIQADIRKALKLCEKFYAESQYNDIGIDSDHLRSVLSELVEKQCLLVDDGCVFGVLVFPCFFNPSYLMAQELFFYVDKENRGRGVGKAMLKFAENHVRNMGAEKLNMLCLEGNRIDGMYKAMGYNQEEIIFSKGL